MGALEELVAAWRANPDADATIALCSYLGGSDRVDLVREVGSSAETWHRDDGDVMLAAGRMFLETDMLAEAQSALVGSGKANPRDARPYRFLGEVLLRRGDAIRAEKVLTRAMKLDASDTDVRLWHDRAVVYIALQKRVGIQAVAAEVARTVPQQRSIPPPSAGAGPAAPAEPWEEQPTVPKPRSAAPTRRASSLPPPLPGARPTAPKRSVPPPLAAPAAHESTAPPALAAIHASAVRASRPPPPGGLPAVPPAPRVPSGVPAPPEELAAAVVPPTPAVVPPTPAVVPPTPAVVPPTPPVVPPTPAVVPPTPPVVPPTPAVAPAAQAIAAGAVAAQAPGLAEYPGSDSLPTLRRAGPGPADVPPVPFEHQPAAELGLAADDSSQPDPRTVLKHLSKVGVFEPEGGAAPAWERAPRERSRGGWVFIAAIVVVAGLGIGGYQYARHRTAVRLEQAKEINRRVAVELDSADVNALKGTDDQLSKVFELNSRSETGARLWLENRVLNALLMPGEAVGIDSGYHRARKVGLGEDRLAFGKMASYLVEGDVAGAAAFLPKWDKRAGDDAHYQLMAGVVLEQAGDARALERYQLAKKLEPKAAVFDLFLARAALMQTGSEASKAIVNAAVRNLGDRPASRALRGLAWALDSGRTPKPPGDAIVTAEQAKQLPVPLQFVPPVVSALIARGEGKSKEQSASLKRALSVSTNPGIATWIGFLAIAAGDEKLGRRAALRALKYNAAYPRARALAARVALVGGRLEEAKKAIEQLDPRSPEVLVVRAVVAYETGDASELKAAVGALDPAVAKLAPFAGLTAAGGVVSGAKYPAKEALQTMASPTVPWGEIIAIDSALDSGDLEFAATLLTPSAQSARPVFEVRRARMLRYQSKLDEAAKALQAAGSGGAKMPARLLLERIYWSVASKKYKDARDLLAKYPSTLGPMSEWVKVLVDASAGQVAQANVKAAQLEPPSPAAPLVLRVLGGRALAAAGDRRGKGYVGSLMGAAPKHPDVVIAAKAIGLIRD